MIESPGCWAQRTFDDLRSASPSRPGGQTPLLSPIVVAANCLRYGPAEMLEAVLLIAGGFLVGSIPSGYLVGRIAGKLDIRDYGSGNVGASNITAHFGPTMGIALGAFDCVIKGALPVLVGRLLGVDLWTQAATGIAAVGGHNWSPMLKMTGGRGVATAIGVSLGLTMWLEILVLGLVILIVGRLWTKDTGLWTFLSLVALPALAYVMRQPVEVVVAAGCIGLLIVTKRLTANWELPPTGYGIGRVLLHRLIWDRDVPRSAEWTGRRPG